MVGRSAISLRAALRGLLAGASWGWDMARIVVLGAGVCGLAAAALLAADGHDVVVLERDRAELPASDLEAWQDWSRHGVAQFRNPHWLHPGGRAVLESQLPAVRNALADSGWSDV